MSETTAKQIVLKFTAFWSLLKNKAAIIIVLAVLTVLFNQLPANARVPFADVFYAVILIAWAFTLTPFARLGFFAEAAEYAEGKGLRRDLGLLVDESAKPAFTPALIHYWYATFISFAVVTSMLFALQGTGL